MLNFVLRQLVRLYPIDFRQEYGDLIIDCIELKVATQNGRMPKFIMILAELIHLVRSAGKQRFTSNKTRQSRILPIVVPATILMVGNQFNPAQTILQYRCISLVTSALATLWLGFSYVRSQNHVYRYLIVVLAVATASLGVGPKQTYISQIMQYIGESLPWLHQNPTIYTSGPVFYLTIWLSYALPLANVFLLAYGLSEVHQKTQLRKV